MPIVKVPQKHRFGIVSLNRVEQLLALSNQQQEEGDRVHGRSHGPSHHSITQAFVTKYNAKPENARESMDIEIKKALQHAKFRAGIVHGNTQSTSPTPPPSAGKSLDVTPYDTSIAWLELALLCQCNGPLQQEILLTLAVSLNSSPVSTAHVPSMVYIAGLCYQWLKSDEEASDVLRTGELILLKILFLISLRLYYHHLTGCLMDICTRDEVRQLKFDVEGFENKERTYRFLPEALLHWKFALEVGLIVCEQYSKSMHDFTIKSASSGLSEPQGSEKSDKCTSSPQPHKNNLSPSNASHGGSNISSILWHALDIWQCAKQKCEVLREAILDLLACSTDFSEEKWMEGILAMNILCSTSQVSLDALELVQCLAVGHEALSKGAFKTKPSTMEQSEKKVSGASIKFKAKSSTPAKGKGKTMLLLPPSREERKAPPSPAKVATLNVLGMQPDFNITDGESVYTADQTVTSYQTLTAERARQYLKKEASANNANLAQNLVHPPRHVTEGSNFVTTVLNSTLTASSIGTQSLIANESIPDALPSAEFSNITMDMGSITTIDPAESLGKSIGLYNSSTTKQMDLSVSNLVSPCLGPSGDLTGKEDTLPSPIAERSVEEFSSTTSGSRTGKPLPPVLVAAPPAGVTGEEKVKRVELKLDLNRLLDEQRESSPGSDTRTDTDASNLVQPQHVKLVIASSSRPDSRCTHYTHSTAPLAEGANMLGSQVHPSTVLRQSMLSSDSSPSSVSVKRLAQFESWPGEVALTYAMCMASVTIYGKTSPIQQTALEGPKVKGAARAQDGSIVRSFGLLELAQFESRGEKCIEGFNDWQIRHAAVLGLFRVNRTCCSLPMKDGLSEVAWSKLVERETAERDGRVLQAFKLAQVVPDLDKPMVSGETLPLFSPLLAHIADGLSELFLPAPPSSHCIVKPRGKPAGVKADMKRPMPQARPSFNTRTFAALDKIAMEYQLKKKEQEEEAESELEACNEANSTA